ncbi:hypothetical protein TNCV_4549181 [Trichonephila clavipes]|nr:hypothetical protein TNCV_4549181 [Trichonephila clavipes]
MIGKVNEPLQHDLSTAVQRLRRGVGGRKFRNVEESCYAVTSWNGGMTKEHVLCQEAQAGLIARLSNMPYHPKNWIEGTVQ